MEYWNASVQGIRQVLDITREFIIHETRAESTECKLHPESGVYIPSDVKEKDAELQFIRETGKWKVCPPSDKLNQNFDLEK